MELNQKKVEAAVILSVVAVAAAGVVHLSHGYAGEGYGHEAVAYAPVAHLAYEAHDHHVDYHVSTSSKFRLTNT
ncbi:unnamed protein product [Leptosia nina]|uniref:Uncharacterized protein n=1 Tax=Leptosia nina TaxID=320188 RepID=A0AAV1JYU0_9NEOP